MFDDEGNVARLAEYRHELERNPDNIGVIQRMASMLRVAGEYGEALQFYQRAAAHERGDGVANALTPGRNPWGIDIACLRWLLGDRRQALQEMHGMVAGILDGSISYGDAAGGVSQGLLLYYMAVTTGERREASFALEYFKNRVDQLRGVHSNLLQVWPCPIARYYLGDIEFESVMRAVNRIPTVRANPTTLELGRRRKFVAALFHDGTKQRAHGDEEGCITRMRECAGLDNTRIDQEWYLARHEVERAKQ
ncbi:MAG: hypothetical protein JOY64_27015 [Alphaproteobacteria bacterium]|nr:hypothetical protein [Alphaproteobacteria bacterium]